MSLAISEPQKLNVPHSLRSRVGIAAPLPGPPGPGVVVPRRRARPDRPGRGRLPAGATLERACGRSRCAMRSWSWRCSGTRVVAPLRWWTKPRTAAEIESRFPQLGQRIRTVVQYAGLSDGADRLRRA